MNIWVCRTGVQGQYQDLFYKNNAIYLTREFLDFDLHEAEKTDIISCLREKNEDAATQTISNTWSQIDIFANRMSIGDIVVVPKKNSMLISITKVTGEYEYSPDVKYPLSHKRSVIFLKKDLDTTSFPQDIRYSLGAFRSIFKISQSDRFIALLRKEGVMPNEV